MSSTGAGPASGTLGVEQFGYKQELQRSLSFTDLLIYGLIFMVPIAPFGIFGSVYQGSGGMVALTYVIGMVAMMFTANSYAQMSRAFPMAGSVYTYAGRGLRPWVGFLSGWAILLDYFQNGDDPNEEEVLKPACFVFDFAPTRALRQLSEYGIGLSPNEPNPENAVKELVSFLPVLAYDGANMTQIDAGGILDIGPMTNLGSGGLFFSGNGILQGNGTLTHPRLYQLIRQPGPITERTFEITFLDPGVQAYAFTFG